MNSYKLVIYWTAAFLVKGITANIESWKNCGGPSDAIRFQDLSMELDPQSDYKAGTFAASFTLDDEIDSSIKIDLTMKTKVSSLGEDKWLKVPCILGETGSCTYDDGCMWLSKICPNEYKDYCQCPFRKGIHSIPPTPFRLPDSVPSLNPETPTDYQIIAAVITTGGKRLGCMEIFGKLP